MSTPRGICLLVACLVIAVFPGRAALGDFWGPFPDQRVVSAGGKYYVVVREEKNSEAVSFELCQRRAGAPPIRPAEVDFLDEDRVSVERDPKDRLLAKGTWNQLPLEVRVLDKEPGVVFFEKHAGVGYGHTLAVVAGDGKVRWSLELMDTIELWGRDGFLQTVSSNWWYEGWWIDEESDRIVLLARNGVALEVALGDGEVTLARPEVLYTRFARGPVDEQAIALTVAAKWHPKNLIAHAKPIEADAKAPLPLRLRAAYAMVSVGGKATAGDLFKVAARAGQPQELREYALEHMGEVLGIEALPVLTEALRRRETKEAEKWTAIGLRLAAVPGLAAVGEPAIPALSEVLRDPSDHIPLRGRIAKAMGAIASPEALPALMYAIGVKDRGIYPSVRAACVRAVGEIGAKAGGAVPLLTKLLDDEDADIREAAAVALGKTGSGSKSAVPALISSLRDERKRVRSAAIRALKELGEASLPAVPELRRILREDPANGETAALTLGALGPKAKAAIPELLQLWRDEENRGTQHDLAVAIAAMGKSALLSLEKRLAAEDPEERSQAAELLGKFDLLADAAVPLLVARLTDEAPPVRVAAAHAIFDLGTTAAAAVPALMTATRDKSLEVRAAAIRAIGTCSMNGTGLELLVTALSDGEPVVRAAAAIGIGCMYPKSRSAIPKLLKLLADKSPEVRAETASAIGWMYPDSKSAVKELRSRLRDKDALVRAVAAEALGEMHPDARVALPDLQKLLKDEDGFVRWLAAMSLQKLLK